MNLYLLLAAAAVRILLTMGKHHFSRREVLASIAVAGKATLLAPLVSTGMAQPQMHGAIRGRVLDAATGAATSAKIRVTDAATGAELWPEHAIRTMPRRPRAGGYRYFYAVGNYEIAVPAGRYRVEIVRGVAHDAVVREVAVPAGSTVPLDAEIPPLRNMQAAGWYSGNTHTHYHLEMDEDPDDHLRIVPPAEALDVNVISYLIRKDLKYISNKYPIGRMPEFSRHGTLVDMGEEARNNTPANQFGYGHVLFLDIPHLIEPASTGMLSPDPGAPDYPTISMLTEEAKRLGGTTIWCHNGKGMELPVAAALGCIDAFNVGDDHEGEYSRYYQFLNCGYRIPISSGTDWFVYDHNRVYVQVNGQFTYDAWLAGLRAGRTFITNGPLLDFHAADAGPGETVQGPGTVPIRARAVSRLPFDRLEVIHDGEVVAESLARDGREASIETVVRFARPGWTACRVIGSKLTHGGFRVFAHSGPVYLEAPGRLQHQQEAARAFVRELGESMDYIGKTYRFRSQADAATAIGRFRQAQRHYRRIAEA